MIKVNKASKCVLDILWNKAKKSGYFKLKNNDVYMPLTVELLPSRQISLCHYGELNGDLMRDPEMVFWKDKNGNYFPFYYRNDYAGYESITGEITGRKLVVLTCYEKLQRDQAGFANTWMVNIAEQQDI